MRTSLGISAGAEVVCSALVATASNGAQSFDYRVVSADAAHSDLGDLVASSIELMTTQLPTTQPPREIIGPIGGRFAGAPRGAEPMTGHPPTSVAVAYRTKEQAQIIRSATGKQRDLRLIPEGTAALTYLKHTGLLDRYDTVAIVDLGASGLSVTVADRSDESLLRSDRTAAVSGKAIDDLIYHHLVDMHFARRGTRPNRGMLTNRGRAAKEHLSIAPAVTIDHVAGRPLKLTRADFEELIADLLRDLALFVTAAFARAPRQPQAVAVIGGGANIPAVLDTLTAALEVPVFTVPDPEAVTAKGAALVADSAQPSVFPVSALGGDAPAGTVTKVFGTLAGALVVVGLIVGYGVKTFAPTSDDEVSPAGTTSSASHLPTPTSAPPLRGRHHARPHLQRGQRADDHRAGAAERDRRAADHPGDRPHAAHAAAGPEPAADPLPRTARSAVRQSQCGAEQFARTVVGPHPVADGARRRGPRYQLGAESGARAVEPAASTGRQSRHRVGAAAVPSELTRPFRLRHRVRPTRRGAPAAQGGARASSAGRGKQVSEPC